MRLPNQLVNLFLTQDTSFMKYLSILLAAGALCVMELGDTFGQIPVATPARLDFWKRFFQTQEAW